MAIDWRAAMNRTYELVRVDSQWREQELVQNLKDCKVTYEDTGLRCSLSATLYERPEDGYYRVYMVCSQGADSARIALATVRIQTPKRSTSGMNWKHKATGYSPLVELDGDYPPVGWTASGNVVQAAASIVAAHCVAPCSYPASAATMAAWTADDTDTWLDCLEAVLSKASMHVEVDGTGTVLFVPDADQGKLAPVFTFDDAAYDLPSILIADVDDSTDWFDLKNKVEVVYSDSGATYVGTAQNDDPKSPISTVARGYVSAMRETSPEIDAPVTQAKVDALAAKLLAEQGETTGEASFKHAFVPDVSVGRCVRLDYTRVGYRVDGIVSKMTLDCTPSAIVSTRLTYKEAV